MTSVFSQFPQFFHIEREEQESYLYEANAIPIYCYIVTYIAKRFSKLLSLPFDLEKNSKRCIHVSVKNNINGHDLSGFLGKFGSLVYWEGYWWYE